MYKYVDASVVKRYNSFCADKLNQLKISLSNEYGIECDVCLIGSGAKNLVTQNENEPFDLDYNLTIHSYPKDWNINNSTSLKNLKDIIRNELNKTHSAAYFQNAQDSTSVLTARLFLDKNSVKSGFSFDVAILIKNKKGNYCRLIHDKSLIERFYWNEVPSSHNVAEKVDELKECGWWQAVRDTYLKLKNTYLRRRDFNHPSFVVYVEAVNQVYNEFENQSE